MTTATVTINGRAIDVTFNPNPALPGSLLPVIVAQDGKPMDSDSQNQAVQAAFKAAYPSKVSTT
jgi:hypothetical protein